MMDRAGLVGDSQASAELSEVENPSISTELRLGLTDKDERRRPRRKRPRTVQRSMQSSMGSSVTPNIQLYNPYFKAVHSPRVVSREGHAEVVARIFSSHREDMVSGLGGISPRSDTVALPKVFLSYAVDQTEFVSLLRADLEKENTHTTEVNDSFPVILYENLRYCEVAIVIMSEAYLRSKDRMKELSIIVESKYSTQSQFAILPLFFEMSEWAMLEEFDEKDIEDYAPHWNGASEEERREWLQALRTINTLEGLYYADEALRDYTDVVLDRIRRLLRADSPEYIHSATLDENILLEFCTGPSETGNTKYDVFLSFRGSDVHMFLRLLYESLSIAGLNVLLGNERLEEGGSDCLRLEMAIKDAAIRIPIFSRNYAGSVGCLQELRHISKSDGLIRPVYYDVTPSDVRCPHRNPYAQAFKKHHGQRRYKRHTIIEWMKALNRISPEGPLQATPG